MKTEDKKREEITINELYHEYLTKEMDEVMSFPEYVECCKLNGMKIVEVNNNGQNQHEH